VYPVERLGMLSSEAIRILMASFAVSNEKVCCFSLLTFVEVFDIDIDFSQTP